LGELRNAYTILVVVSERERLVGIPERISEDNIKVDFRERPDSVCLAKDRSQCCNVSSEPSNIISCVAERLSWGFSGTVPFNQITTYLGE
jgi:hypothetical protein